MKDTKRHIFNVVPEEPEKKTPALFGRVQGVISALPIELQVFIAAMAAYFKIYPELIFTGLLTILAYPMMNCFKVQIKDGWTEALALYSLTVAKPSEKKSPVLEKLLTPVRTGIEKYNEITTSDFRKAKTACTLLAQELKKAEADKMRGKIPIEKVFEIQERLDTAIKAVSKYQRLRLVTGDITPEALGVTLQNNLEQLLIASSEGSLFQNMAGKYSDGKENIDLLLQAWSGYAVDTIRISRDAVELKNPLLTLLLFIQPKMLKDITSNKDFIERGLLARFLIAMPDSYIGSRDFSEESPMFDDAQYSLLVQRLMHMFRIMLHQKPEVIHFSEEARQKLYDFQNAMEPHLLRDLVDVQGLCGKMAGIVARIAAVLHTAENVLDFNASHPGDCSDGEIKALMRQVVDTEISGETIKNAIQIGMYYIGEALYVYDVTGLRNTAEVEYAVEVESKLVRAAVNGNRNLEREPEDDGLYYINHRGLLRLFHVSEKTTPANYEALMRAIETLVAKGSLCEESRVYYLNPKLL